jgi:hypothetical protein
MGYLADVSSEDGPDFERYQCWCRPQWRVYDRRVVGVFAVLSMGIVIVAVIMAALLPVSIPYQRQLRQQLRSIAVGAAQRPRVYWQAGRWDTDPSHAYVANIGDDTAYEVSVTACGRVVGRTRSVPPCRADWMLASSTLPCYVSFRVDQRSSRQVSLGGGAQHGGSGKAVDPHGPDVAVRVSWRSKNDDWFTQTVRADGPIPTPQVVRR